MATTVSRLANRYANKVRNADNGLWHDDAFAALAACGGLYVLGTLVAIGTFVVLPYCLCHVRLTEWTACHAPVLNLLEYQLALFGYYFIVWCGFPLNSLEYLLRSEVGHLEPAWS